MSCGTYRPGNSDNRTLITISSRSGKIILKCRLRTVKCRVKTSHVLVRCSTFTATKINFRQIERHWPCIIMSVWRHADCCSIQLFAAHEVKDSVARLNVFLILAGKNDNELSTVFHPSTIHRCHGIALPSGRVQDEWRTSSWRRSSWPGQEEGSSVAITVNHTTSKPVRLGVLEVPETSVGGRPARDRRKSDRNVLATMPRRVDLKLPLSAPATG